MSASQQTDSTIEESQAVAYRSVWTFIHRTPHQLGFVTVGGYRTRYLEAGERDRPAVILLHGVAGSLENFTANIAAYAEHFHVVAIDMLGCGWTDKPDRQLTAYDWSAHVRAVMDELGIERASLVGVSLGSWISARVAQDAPDRVDRIVMISPAGIILDLQEFRDRLALTRSSRAKASTDVTWAGIRTVFEQLILDDANVIDDVVAVRFGVYSDPAMQRAMQFVIPDTEEGILTDDDWRAFPHPVLVIAATDVSNIYLRNAYRIGELAPKAEVLEMTGCDHWAQFERADEFNAKSIEFLGGGS
ncbi:MULTISPECIES: alpha/beta fold hydrolase [unclassified Pseudofrankia]|uniref:alpha/beta fold hydrolase n=1 Tax=unclassified Pseudofrankia TaxID=2994372 RepID=UPI0008DA1093|nr:MULTISPECIES: alpha/beta fold hydrolase [unclassified Pseudofrankia]MDT3446720.1 alpha/beta fold hydrolase [Pseudofrankia sp. BMG5.37]OHV57536.1 hypothetical protein BCD48_43025 [Pseudofrankia sp. BMG5.36]